MEAVKDPKPRTLEQVREQYKELCNAAGALTYQIEAQKLQLQAVMETMSSVNLEASKLVEEATDGSSENH